MHSVLDEGITKKIQALDDKCINECAAPLFMNAQNSADRLDAWFRGANLGVAGGFERDLPNPLFA